MNPAQQAISPESKRIRENSKKAKEAADQLFPNEKWKDVEERIYLSPNRPVGKGSNYKDELCDAQILRDLGSTIYFVPDDSRLPGKKYDAIVDGMKMEFKNQCGASVRTLRDHFLTSRGQAPNVFINLEKSPLTRQQIMSNLYTARNSPDYAKKNAFKGGRVIIKFKGQGKDRMIYLNVNNLKAPK